MTHPFPTLRSSNPAAALPHGRPVHLNTSRYAPVAHTSAAAQPARMSEGKCTHRYTRDRPTIGTNTAIAATTGQRQRVGQASRTSTAASVIEPIAWPRGKMKLCSGGIDSHTTGRESGRERVGKEV